MKKYFITSMHDVYVNDFKEGETDNVNCYQMKDFVTADNWRDAALKYLNDKLGYNVSLDDLKFSENTDCLVTSVVVDEENTEATKTDIEDWKNGSKMLYVNHIDLFIEQTIPVDLKSV